MRRVSGFNETLYRIFVSPFVQHLATPWTAEMCKWLHPMRTSRYLFSEAFNPWMRGVATLADAIVKSRQPLAQDHPGIAREREMIGEVTHVLEGARKSRDAVCERIFSLLYGNFGGANGHLDQVVPGTRR